MRVKQRSAVIEKREKEKVNPNKASGAHARSKCVFSVTHYHNPCALSQGHKFNVNALHNARAYEISGVS